jgi:hypothetical protein
MTTVADNARFTLTGNHDPFPGCLWSSAWSVDVREFADVVDLGRSIAAAEFAFTGQQALNNLRAFIPWWEPELLEGVIHCVHPIRNSLEGDAAEYSN